MKFCEEMSKSNERVLRFADAEGRPAEEKHVGTEKIRLVHTVAAATSAAVTEDRIVVEKWLRAWDRDTDSSLEGAIVTVKGEDAFRTFNAESEKPLTRAGNN